MKIKIYLVADLELEHKFYSPFLCHFLDLVDLSEKRNYNQSLIYIENPLTYKIHS